MEQIRILADVMNYLEQEYCRESRVDWVRTSPVGAAYSIVRDLFIEVVDAKLLMNCKRRRSVPLTAS